MIFLFKGLSVLFRYALLENLPFMSMFMPFAFASTYSQFSSLLHLWRRFDSSGCVGRRSLVKIRKGEGMKIQKSTVFSFKKILFVFKYLTIRIRLGLCGRRT